MSEIPRSSWDTFMAGFDRRGDPRPLDEPTETELVFAMIDELRDERATRDDRHWFPAGGTPALERLARERLAARRR